MINFKETSILPPSEDENGKYKNQKFFHICEICGKREVLTPEEGFEKGWDYSPRMYPFKVISPRTCGQCSIKGTAWWEIAANHKSYDELTDKQKQTIQRIYGEPESIIAENG